MLSIVLSPDSHPPPRSPQCFGLTAANLQTLTFRTLRRYWRNECFVCYPDGLLLHHPNSLVPIHLEVLRGNRADTTPLHGLLKRLKRRFGIQEAVFVFDGGMSSSLNLAKRINISAIGWMKKASCSFAQTQPGMASQRRKRRTPVPPAPITEHSGRLFKNRRQRLQASVDSNSR
jgi:hypothetical protein